ncbi:MAG: SH3 domain-containing protein [Saccharospirillum sp.]
MADTLNNVTANPFWLTHSDPAHSAVHLALHWLSFVYPESEPRLGETLAQALPDHDKALSEQWHRFLHEGTVEEHVVALEWLSETLSPDQTPFLMETAWRLLLADHTLPNQVPLALRLLARILKLPDRHVFSMGERIWEEQQDAGAADVDDRSVLLPDDPRYLDRVEWRLYGNPSQSGPSSRPSTEEPSVTRGFWHHGLSFLAGVIMGVSVLAFLVWGPVELGVQRVPTVSHTPITAVPPPEPAEDPAAELDTAIAELLGDIPELAGDLSSWEPASEAYSDLLADALSELETPPEVAPEETAPESETEAAAEPEAGEAAAVGAPEAQTPPQEPEITEVEMRVTASVLNVREQPRVDSQVIMQLSEGQRVWVDPQQREGDWERLRLNDLEGYASGQFLVPIDSD